MSKKFLSKILSSRGTQKLCTKSVSILSSKFAPPSKTDSKWSFLIEEYDDPDAKLFKCFNPPEEGPFVAGELYRWGWCIDGIVIYDDDDAPTVFGTYEPFQYFAVLTGW